MQISKLRRWRLSSSISCSMPTKVLTSCLSSPFAISWISPLLDEAPSEPDDSYVMPRVCQTTRESAPAPAHTPMHLGRLRDLLGDLAQRGLGVAFLVVDSTDVLCNNPTKWVSYREAALTPPQRGNMKMRCSPCTA